MFTEFAIACAVLDVPTGRETVCSHTSASETNAFAFAFLVLEPEGASTMFPRYASDAFLSKTSRRSFGDAEGDASAIFTSLAGSGMARCRLEAARVCRRATPGGTLRGPRSRSSPDAARVTSAPPRGSDHPRDPSRLFAFANRPPLISCDDAARLAPPRDASRAAFKEQTHTCEVDAVSWRPRAALGKAETPAETPEVAHIFTRHPGRKKRIFKRCSTDSAADAPGLEVAGRGSNSRPLEQEVASWRLSSTSGYPPSVSVSARDAARCDLGASER